MRKETEVRVLEQKVTELTWAQLQQTEESSKLGEKETQQKINKAVLKAVQQKEAEHQKEIESLKNKLASTAANTQMESIIQQRIEENTKRQSVEMEKLQ